MRTPVSWQFGDAVENTRKFQYDSDYIILIKNHLDKVHTFMKENIVTGANKMTDIQGHINKPFVVGDLVMV